MYRKSIAFTLALYAIAFAFGALVSVRWPSLMMAAGILGSVEPDAAVASVDWRQLGVAYGGPYLLTAICFYFSASLIIARKRGGVMWFTLACAIGFPCAFIIDFEPGWMAAPSAGEIAVCFAGSMAAVMALAVWDLRIRRAPQAAATGEATPQEPELDNVIPLPVAVKPEPEPEQKRRRPPGPVPAAIARQRAMFAAQGRRDLARRKRY